MASLSLATACHRHCQRHHRQQSSPPALLFSLPMRKSWLPSSPSALERNRIKAMFPGGDQSHFTRSNLKAVLVKSIFLSVVSVVSGFVLRRRGRLATEPPGNQEHLISSQEEQETSHAEDSPVLKILQDMRIVNAFLEFDPHWMQWGLMKYCAEIQVKNLDFARRAIQEIRNEGRISEDEFYKEKEYSIMALSAKYGNYLQSIEIEEKAAAQMEEVYMGFFMDRFRDMWVFEDGLDAELSAIFREHHRGIRLPSFPEDDLDYTSVLNREPFQCEWSLLHSYSQWRLKKLNRMKHWLQKVKSNGGEHLEALYKRTCAFKEEYELIWKQIDEYEMKTTEDRVWNMSCFKKFYVQTMKKEKSLHEFVESLLKA